MPHIDNPEKFYHRKLKLQFQSTLAQPLTPPRRVLVTPNPPPMATPWLNDTFKPLDTTEIKGAPHALPQNFNDWLPKFSSSSVITIKNSNINFNSITNLENKG